MFLTKFKPAINFCDPLNCSELHLRIYDFTMRETDKPAQKLLSY